MDSVVHSHFLQAPLPVDFSFVVKLIAFSPAEDHKRKGKMASFRRFQGTFRKKRQNQWFSSFRNTYLAQNPNSGIPLFPAADSKS